MATLTDVHISDYASLLGRDIMDSLGGPLVSGTPLNVNTDNRTILIGIGGMGVHTIDAVKRELNRRMSPGWNNYVAFLGIDTDWKDLEDYSCLDADEKLLLGAPGAQNRLNSPLTCSPAIRKLITDPRGLRAAGAMLDHPVGRQYRVLGKLKLFDQSPEEWGFDEQIGQRLTQLVVNKLYPMHYTWGILQVYVIGSLCGGTSGAAIPHMPPIIRKALRGVFRLKVNAMLYTPDTVQFIDPEQQVKIFANSYATLKEVNYYQGMYLRQGYPEGFPSNAPHLQDWKIASRFRDAEGFYDVPYLIGTPSGPYPGSYHAAVETVVGYLTGILTEVKAPNGFAPSFDHTSQSHYSAEVTQRLTNEPLPLQAQPKRYMSLGFAEGVVPEQLLRSYCLGRACDLAGFKPMDPVDRATFCAEADNARPVPFRGRFDLYNATEGTAKAERLLSPLNSLMQLIHSGRFDFAQDLNATSVTCTKIRNGEYDTPAISAETHRIVSSRTGSAEMAKLGEFIENAYREFRRNVQCFVMEEGPYAFVSLYQGRFMPVGDDYGVGIHQMLQHLVNGMAINGRNVYFPTADQAKEYLDRCRQEIMEQKPLLVTLLPGKSMQLAEKWRDAYEKWCQVRISTARRQYVFGSHGALAGKFLRPAAQLAQELEAFGGILETMANIYCEQGYALSDYEAFRFHRTNHTELNIAGINPAGYEWMKGRAEEALIGFNGFALREYVVNHFFGVDPEGIPNSVQWLTYNPRLEIVTPDGRHRLANANTPVQARVVFDEVVTQVFQPSVSASMEEVFTQLERSRGLDNAAHYAISNLCNRSVPLANAAIPNKRLTSVLIYPDALNYTVQGARIVNALQMAASTQCQAVTFCPNVNARTIQLFQILWPFELSRLHHITHWEREYEAMLNLPGNYLHASSPAIDMEEYSDVNANGEKVTCPIWRETISWSDYPPVTAPDGKTAEGDSDAPGREVGFRLEQNKIISRAREAGILFSELTRDGWQIKHFCFPKDFEPVFDIRQYMPDCSTGLYPLGKTFIEFAAAQNGFRLDDITYVVKLHFAGALSSPSESEDRAWEAASEVLRHHIPMYIEIRNTVEQFSPWLEEIEKINNTAMELNSSESEA